MACLEDKNLGTSESDQPQNLTANIGPLNNIGDGWGKSVEVDVQTINTVAAEILGHEGSDSEHSVVDEYAPVMNETTPSVPTAIFRIAGKTNIPASKTNANRKI
jgi:hypothetical protein